MDHGNRVCAFGFHHGASKNAFTCGTTDYRVPADRKRIGVTPTLECLVCWLAELVQGLRRSAE